MTEHKIGEVFIDTKNFQEPKMMKCIEEQERFLCNGCVHLLDNRCIISNARNCLTGRIIFIETNETLTTE